MSDPMLWKKWQVTKAHLRHARQMLPSQPIENDGEHPDQEMGTVARYEEAIDVNELALALDQLEGLGLLNNCPGGFWCNMERAALEMGLIDRAKSFREEMNEALGGDSSSIS